MSMVVVLVALSLPFGGTASRLLSFLASALPIAVDGMERGRANGRCDVQPLGMGYS